ncbi:uncharacterized protein BT62DRAFT_1011610 [Guyanagaster necrorhizus]|uniref:Uncharacterized protein n=1 Tax=Guyanagaster necrorhizus TaxID=856835 RepID=A0A9P8AN21_9AGAR|nr:uncharacterized protein BT62DRAFT_1011610 [Guyanagaster necrorhizus MCA 3950]KAG7441364.1 hypothetical protein BT62DRAFT_1011610 [Guyanagaster necrorhizus MCA 3950]
MDDEELSWTSAYEERLRAAVQDIQLGRVRPSCDWEDWMWEIGFPPPSAPPPLPEYVPCTPSGTFSFRSACLLTSNLITLCSRVYNSHVKQGEILT